VRGFAAFAPRITSRHASVRGGHGVKSPADLATLRVHALDFLRSCRPGELVYTITGHSPAVWARFYARSFGKAQRDEARRRMLEHGFGA
jgi:hypothetical protein